MLLALAPRLSSLDCICAYPDRLSGQSIPACRRKHPKQKPESSSQKPGAGLPWSWVHRLRRNRGIWTDQKGSKQINHSRNRLVWVAMRYNGSCRLSLRLREGYHHRVLILRWAKARTPGTRKQAPHHRQPNDHEPFHALLPPDTAINQPQLPEPIRLQPDDAFTVKMGQTAAKNGAGMRKAGESQPPRRQGRQVLKN